MGGQPLVTRSSFRTRDPELAHRFLETVYADHTMRVSNRRDGFLFRHVMTGADRFAVARVRHTERVHIAAEPLKDVLSVTTFHRGPGEITAGRDSVRPGRNEPVLTPTGRMHTWWDDLDNTSVVLDHRAGAEHAAAVCGTGPDGLVFLGMRPASVALAAYWQATVAHVRTEVLAAPHTAGPLVVAGAFRALATALLVAFPNTAHGALTGGAPARRETVSADRLRRAVEHIDAHAHEPIGPADLAEATGVRFRDLHRTLRERRGHSPGQQLWRARLAGAHRDLRVADPADAGAVATIAARWGFARPDRFAAAYAATYGHPPDRTPHDRG